MQKIKHLKNNYIQLNQTIYKPYTICQLADTKFGSSVYGDVVNTVPLVSSNIAWDDTNKVFSISKSGIYEVVCDCKLSITSTFTATLKVYINTAADTLGTAVQSESFELDSGDDPLPATVRWMGKVQNGEHIAVTLDAGSRTPKFEEGSTLRILRIV